MEVKVNSILMLILVLVAVDLVLSCWNWYMLSISSGPLMSAATITLQEQHNIMLALARIEARLDQVVGGKAG